ncbi:MAG: glycoside hydrolase family 57 protein [Candidatus Omnitrophica bacterium]|nr:glycoside hydrolase family 57 protein [Candidatus Omnitrophota bacterium]
MLNLAIIFHMHQPYYKNLLTNETEMPWVRLHGAKDYLDMVQMLANYPKIHQTFNLVPSLLEQLEDYANRNVKDKFLELSYKNAKELTDYEKNFIRDNFFSINRERVISTHARYYELLLKKEHNVEYQLEDYLDLQVWFNLSWIDQSFRSSIPELKRIVEKGRFFSEEDKHIVLDKQLYIIEDVIPGYKKALERKQVELTLTPFYHPILPLVYNTKLAKEANPRAALPRNNFAYPEDAWEQIEEALHFFKERFGNRVYGMWPSEQSVCEHILPFIIDAGINWIVADEAILFRSLKAKKRDTRLLYQPHLLKREKGSLNIVFRDRNLSDLLGFVYHRWIAKDAVNDFLKHLENIATAYKNEDALVVLAMDGENAWEYYSNDGHDFLELLYQELSKSEFVKTVTISEYLQKYPAKHEIKRLAAGSWIFGDFGKWIGNPTKIKAWEYLAAARKELQSNSEKIPSQNLDLAWKQMHICEGSDWFWWAGEDPHGGFDILFRQHLSNFYTLIGKDIPDYLNRPL